MAAVDQALLQLARRGLGVFSRADAKAVGASDEQLRRRVEDGRLERVGRRAFRIGGSSATPLDDLRAEVVNLQPEAWATGPTGAALLGFDGFRVERPFHVLVPRSRCIRRAGLVVERSIEIPLIDRATCLGLPTTSAARTVIQLAKSKRVDNGRLAASIDSAIRDGLLSEDLLHRRIVALRQRGRHGLPRLHAVLAGFEVTRGGHSWLEREYLRLCAEAGLPTPTCQQVLTKAEDALVRVDFHFPDTNVVVEVLGFGFHRTPSQMARDSKRYNSLIAAGFLPYQFTYGELVTEPDTVVRTTVDALARAAHRPGRSTSD